MKRMALLFLVLLAIASTFAPTARGVVASREEMERAATNWLSYVVSEHGSFAGNPAARIDGIEEIREDGDLLGLCVSVAPRGHIIVSVLKEMQPICMFSEESDVDFTRTYGYPQLVRDVLSSRQDLYASVFGSLEAQQPSRNPLYNTDYARQWEMLLRPPDLFLFSLGDGVGTAIQLGPLMTTSWGQGPPYNNDCPGEGQSATMAGCVPVSIGQIMNYHEWPPAGVGSHEYMWYGTQYCVDNLPPQMLSADFSDPYDWASMPDSCDLGCTPEREAAVAELCYEVGVAFEADWDCDGTGVYTSGTSNVLSTYFRYHDAVQTFSHIAYPTAQAWWNLLRDQIKVQRPVMYTFSFGQTARHAITVDGVRSETFNNYQILMYHINYDWDGNNNGWFLVDDIPYTYDPIHREYFYGNIAPNYIQHTAIEDQAEHGQSYPATAVFDLPGQSLPATFKVVYTTRPAGGGAGSGPYTLTMTATGQPREYTAAIPAQSADTIVEYYIEGQSRRDLLTPPVVYRTPLFAPETRFSFLVWSDTTPPEISLEPVYDLSIWDWAPTVLAYVYDDHQVDSVRVEWSKNQVAQAPFSLSGSPGSPLYQGEFPGTVVPGDSISYRVRATDAWSNDAFQPPLEQDPFVFRVIDGLVAPFESDMEEWMHEPKVGWNDDWHLTYDSNHTEGGYASYRAGSWYLMGGYSEYANGWLLSPPVVVGAGAELSFWHSVETNTTPWQQTSRALDGGLVEVSTDGGTTWTQITPVEGYDMAISDPSSGPFAPGTMVFAGLEQTWRQVHFDLGAYEDDVVTVRWRFGSDGSDDGVLFGWYVDDVVLEPCTLAPPRPAEAGDNSEVAEGILCTPNPSGGSTTITFRTKGVSEEVRLSVYDVTGRRVVDLQSGKAAPGVHRVVWDGRDADGVHAGQGIYFVKLRVGSEIQGTKLLLIE